MGQRLFSCIAVLAGMVGASGAFAQSAVSPAVPSNSAPLYTIQPNDLLQVFVWKEPEISSTVLVRPDGRISIPLVQDLQAAGLTPDELKQKLEQALQQYIDTPSATVIVEAIQSYRVFVTGKVVKPGMISMEKPINVLQVLALAGGFTEFAKPDEIVIIRTVGPENTLFPFNYSEVMKGKNSMQNMMLQSGDVVVVQ